MRLKAEQDTHLQLK